jgi:nucleoside-diphosphate-sugar epimerase
MEDFLRVFVTGGTGFVGSGVVNKLIEHGHDIVLLVRSQRSIKHPASCNSRPDFVIGSIQDIVALKKGISGCDAVIHLVGIIREVGTNTFRSVHYEGTRNVVEAAKSVGIKRFIHMSAEGTKPFAQSNYHKTKFLAEEYVKSSGLNYTIFRPSILFGPGDKNFNVLADLIIKAPFIPIIGNGNYKWQPVSVKNVAELFVLALENRKAEGKTYEVRGPDVFTFNQILDILMEVLGIKKPKGHIPVVVARPIIHILDKLLSSLPITSDQLKMLLDNYDHPVDNLLRDFDIDLIPFEKGLREYISKGEKIHG